MDTSAVSEALREGPANPGPDPPRRARAKGVSLPGTLPEGYEHFAYTPYGESWVEEEFSFKTTSLSHRFTGQELDAETGLYAFPARYYDPQTSRWLGADPAMNDYLPRPGQGAGDLPGMGGVFDPTNLAVYHYTSNNPLRYVDPSGMSDSFAIEYYDNFGQERIEVTIDGETMEVGQGLDFGSTIPGDARVTVPDGSYLEISNDRETYKFFGGANLSVDDFNAALSEIAATDEYQADLRAQRRAGLFNTVLGGSAVLGGVILGAAAAPASGNPIPGDEAALLKGAGGLILGGLNHLAFGIGDIASANSGVLSRYDLSVEILVRSPLYVGRDAFRAGEQMLRPVIQRIRH